MFCELVVPTPGSLLPPDHVHFLPHHTTRFERRPSLVVRIPLVRDLVAFAHTFVYAVEVQKYLLTLTILSFSLYQKILS
jgi:hypothetical protein